MMINTIKGMCEDCGCTEGKEFTLKNEKFDMIQHYICNCRCHKE